MLRLFLRLLTFFAFSALNGAFAQPEVITQVKSKPPREDTVLAVVVPPRVEVVNGEALAVGSGFVLPKLAPETDFTVAAYVFIGKTRTIKHRARAPPKH
jgi:hypothetical protein